MEALLAENHALRQKLKKRDEPLIAKVRKLENYKSTVEQRWAAELRVAKSFIEEEIKNKTQEQDTQSF